MTEELVQVALEESEKVTVMDRFRFHTPAEMVRVGMISKMDIWIALAIKRAAPELKRLEDELGSQRIHQQTIAEREEYQRAQDEAESGEGGSGDPGPGDST